MLRRSTWEKFFFPTENRSMESVSHYHSRFSPR